MSSGRAGGQLGRSDSWRGLRLRQFSGCWVSGNCGDLRLRLDDNYSRTITNITTEAQSTRRTNERRRLLLRSSAPFLNVVAVGVRARLPLVAAACGAGPSGLAAMSPGRASLPNKRSHSGGAGGRSGLRARTACLWQEQFSGRGIGEAKPSVC